MKPQEPAEGILLQSDWGDTRQYSIECECTDPEHGHTLYVESDPDEGVTLTIYTKSQTPVWRVSRWKMIWKLLTTGVINYEVSLLLREQPALNYAAAIKKAAKEVKGFKR